MVDARPPPAKSARDARTPPPLLRAGTVGLLHSSSAPRLGGTVAAPAAQPHMRFVPRRFLVKHGQQLRSRRRRQDGTMEHDVLGGQFLPIELLVGLVVWTKRGPFERDARKQSTGPRVTGFIEFRNRNHHRRGRREQ